MYREHRTAEQRVSRISAICSGPGRCSGLTAVGIAIGAGCSRRLFTVRASRTTRRIIEDETLRESANWPENKEFRILEPMNRITLNVILRTIFGADGAELEQLREIVPPYMKLGSAHGSLCRRRRSGPRRHSPWRKLDEFRRAFDRIVCTLIDRAEADPDLGERTDILALLVRSRRDDGTGMSRRDICDELLTLIGAGHETTASALGWAFERLRRHPDVLAELVREVDEAAATFVGPRFWSCCGRTVVDVVGRRVRAPNFDLGAVADPARSHRAGAHRRSSRESGNLPSPRTIRSESLLRGQASGTGMAGVRWRNAAVHRR